MRTEEATHTTRNGMIRASRAGSIGDALDVGSPRASTVADEFFLRSPKFRQGEPLLVDGAGIGFLAMGGLFALITVHALYGKFVHCGRHGLIGVVLHRRRAADQCANIHCKLLIDVTLRSMKEDKRTSNVRQDIKRYPLRKTSVPKIGRKIELIDENVRYENENMKGTSWDLAGAMTETEEDYGQSTRMLNPAQHMNALPRCHSAGWCSLVL